LIWAKDLSKRDQAALNQKLDLLEVLEFKQAIGLKLLVGPISKSGHILKLRARADKALRPLLCKGPHSPNSEYTLLVGADERDSQLHPAGALEKAQTNRQIVLEDAGRRVKHERP
jgi:hypothetical protein